MVFSMLLIEFVIASADQEACVTEASDGGVGAALLQAGSTKLATIQNTKSDKAPSASKAQKQELGPSVAVGKASSVLPAHLHALGLQLLKTEEFLDAFVTNSIVVTKPYAGVNVTLRMVDRNQYSIIEDDTYGIDSLVASTSGPKGMMNMLDIGGNYGRVSIAAFKRHQSKMRIIVAEPLASTFFLLKWNLWLNNVTELTPEQFQASPHLPGVVALNNGIADVNGKVTDLCYRPPVTNWVRVCNCSHVASDPATQCHHIIGLTATSLVQMFGNVPLSMVKLDCEGCEIHVLPELSALTKTSGLRIERFAGELHGVPNELEQFACDFQQGQWFQHVCGSEAAAQKLGKKGFFAANLAERCVQGSSRPSCSRRTLKEIRTLGLPPSEWA